MAEVGAPESEHLDAIDEQLEPEESPERLRTERRAADYAWRWFEYHAGQRQAVFRFYLILVGAVSAAYLTAMQSESRELSSWSFIFGALLAGLSFLFWRLDCRSWRLVKLAETYLKRDEEELARRMGRREIMLAELADVKEGNSLVSRRFRSFRQIYGYMFGAIGFLSLIVFSVGAGEKIYRVWLLACPSG